MDNNMIPHLDSYANHINKKWFVLIVQKGNIHGIILEDWISNFDLVQRTNVVPLKVS